MTRMIPPLFVNNESAGERLLFERLRDDADTDNWVAFHSVVIRNHIRKKQGEADFIVLIPDMGILCIEVKAARYIRRSCGNWYFGDDATPHPESPFRQVNSARESVRQYLKGQDKELGKIPCFSLVVFSHCNFTDTDISFERNDYLNKRDLLSASVSKLIVAVMEKRLYEFSEKYSWFNRNSSHLTISRMKSVVKALRRDFEVFISPKDRANEVYKELKRFTDQQFKVFDAIEENPRVLVKGAAGSGKTFVGIEACRRAATAGKRVLFLCFNQALGHMLKEEFASLCDNVWAGTLHSYMREVAGLNVDRDDSDFWSRALPESAFDAINDPTFDYLVVDEAQDILNENYLLVLSASLKGSLSDGCWLMLGDFCYQNLFSEDGGVERLKGCYGQFTTAVLKDNCRNTPRIVETIKHICALDEGFYNAVLRADNGENTHWKSYETQVEQTVLLKSVLKSQRKRYPDHEIIILSTQKDGCAGKISDAYWKDILCDKIDVHNMIRYTTIHSFKGLEAQSVILTDINAFEGKRAKMLFYIAASRATSELTVLYEKSTEEQLMSIGSKGSYGDI